MIASFVRGLSVRDVHATIAEALGDQAAISNSTVSKVCKAIRAEYQAWAHRRLDEITLDYLFLDACFFRMYPARRPNRAGRLGITSDAASLHRIGTRDGRVDRRMGRLPNRPAPKRPWPSAADRLRRRKAPDRRRRTGFPKPCANAVLCIACGTTSPKSPPGADRDPRRLLALFDTTDLTVEPDRAGQTGRRAERRVRRQIHRPVPGGDADPAHRRAGSTAYLRFPVDTMGGSTFKFYRAHLRRTKRRTKVIGRFPGETSAISLLWAGADRAWRPGAPHHDPPGTRLLRPAPITTRPTPELRPPSTTSGDADQADPISATA